MLPSTFAVVANLATYVICAVIFIKGGAPEKWGAVIFVLAALLTPLLNTRDGVRFGVLIIDGLTLIGFVWLSLRWRQLWSLFAAAFVLEDVICHLAMVLVPGIGGYGYVIGLLIWGGYGLTAAFAFAIWEIALDKKHGLRK